MSIDSIAAKFLAYKELAEVGKKEIENILNDTPLERTKREIQDKLERNQQYRSVILKNVTTFCKYTSLTIIYSFILIVATVF